MNKIFLATLILLSYLPLIGSNITIKALAPDSNFEITPDSISVINLNNGLEKTFYSTNLIALDKVSSIVSERNRDLFNVKEYFGLEVYDINGQQLHKSQDYFSDIFDKMHSLGLTNGLFLIKVNTSEGILFEKVTISHQVYIGNNPSIISTISDIDYEIKIFASGYEAYEFELDDHNIKPSYEVTLEPTFGQFFSRANVKISGITIFGETKVINNKGNTSYKDGEKRVNLEFTVNNSALRSLDQECVDYCSPPTMEPVRIFCYENTDTPRNAFFCYNECGNEDDVTRFFVAHRVAALFEERDEINITYRRGSNEGVNDVFNVQNDLYGFKIKTEKYEEDDTKFYVIITGKENIEQAITGISYSGYIHDQDYMPPHSRSESYFSSRMQDGIEVSKDALIEITIFKK